MSLCFPFSSTVLCCPFLAQSCLASQPRCLSEMTKGKSAGTTSHSQPYSTGGIMSSQRSQCFSEPDMPPAAVSEPWQLGGSISSLDDISLTSTTSETAPVLRDCPMTPPYSAASVGDLEAGHRGHLLLTLQPARHQTVMAGESIVLRVQADDRLQRPISYQWYHGCQPLSGETQNILILHDLTPGQSGQYQCVACICERMLLLDAQNQSESIVSSPAEVQVLEVRQTCKSSGQIGIRPSAFSNSLVAGVDDVLGLA